MARDHRQLRVFQEADALVLSIYAQTANVPRHEWFGIRAQIRRAAVSVATNIVEGNARRSTAEYVNFLNIARGSAAEVEYLVQLATDLRYIPLDVSRGLLETLARLIPHLEALIRRMAQLRDAE